MKKDNKKPLTDSQRRKRADDKKRAEGFVKVANHWVHGSKREAALAAVAAELKKAKYQNEKS